MKNINNIKIYITLYYSSNNDTFFVRVLPKQIADSINKQKIQDEVALSTMRLIKFMGYPQCEYWNYTECTYTTVEEFEKNLPGIISQLITEKDSSLHTIRYYEDLENIYISFPSNFIFLPVKIYGEKIYQKTGKNLVVTRDIDHANSIELEVKISDIKNGKIIDVVRNLYSVSRT